VLCCAVLTCSVVWCVLDSLMLSTDTFAKENATIREIQTHMETFFQQRDTPIARDGLTALTNTLAGIYYIPFKVWVAGRRRRRKRRRRRRKRKRRMCDV
jgi:hypothetical protein